MVLNKWFVALLQLVLMAVVALQAMRVDGVTTVEVWQFVALLVSSFGAVFLPLLDGAWHAALKVIAALVGAGIAALIPLLNAQFTLDSAIVIALAVLNALAVQFGVEARIDNAKRVLVDPTKSNAVATVVDPSASRIAAASIVANPDVSISEAFLGHGQ